MRTLALLASLLLLVSCVRTVQTPQFAHPSYGVNETMTRQVRNAKDAGDGDYRIKALRRRVTATPQDLQARLELADLYRESGFPDVAIEHYRVAASQHPDSGHLAILIAKTLRTMQMPEEARASLESFTAQHPKSSADALSLLGILQDDSREYGKAEANYRAALSIAPDSDAFHNNLGYNLLLQKRSVEAVPEFRKALELNPKSQTARNNLGLAAPAEALKTWSTDVDAATAHSNMAALLIEQGDYSAARREIDSALGYNKDHSAALRNLQLLTELDGGTARLPDGQRQPESRWGKFSRAMKVVMVGSGQQQ